MGQLLCWICRKKWLHFDISLRHCKVILLVLFSIFEEINTFLVLSLQDKAFQKIEKMKSKVADEQETQMQIKAVG